MIQAWRYWTVSFGKVDMDTGIIVPASTVRAVYDFSSKEEGETDYVPLLTSVSVTKDNDFYHWIPGVHDRAECLSVGPIPDHSSPCSPFFHYDNTLPRIVSSDIKLYQDRNDCGYSSFDQQSSCTRYINAKSIRLYQQAFSRASIIMGMANLWGNCYAHEYGWRSEYAAPILLMAPDDLQAAGNKIINALSKTYSIPIEYYNLDNFLAGVVSE